MSRSTLRRRTSAGLLAAGLLGTAVPAALALTAGAAQAATPASVRVVSGAAVVYDGGAGQANNVRVFLDRGQLAITDSAPITTSPGSGCQVVSGKALCGTGITGLSMTLGDLDDRVIVETPLSGAIRGDDGNDLLRAFISGGRTGMTYDGGAGFRDTVEYRTATAGVNVSLDDVGNDGRVVNGDRDNVRSTVEHLVGSTFADTLIGSNANNTIEGLAGDDTIRGLGGTDFFPMGFGVDGADSISGGEGERDAVSYHDRSRGVTVDLDNVNDDGEPGERDNVGTDVENASGTEFGDTLIGSSVTNQLQGFAGVDLLSGQGGRDSLRAGDGADTVFGDAGDDSLTDNRDGDRDTLACGDDVDSVSFESGIDSTSNCERVF